MNKYILFASLLTACGVQAQLSYAPIAGEEGSTAIHKESTSFVAWAANVEVVRGYVQISDPTISHNGSNLASYGVPADATGMPDNGAVSLGDGGTAVVTFALPVANGDGYDFAVFENGTDTFLELAFVEVSSDGVNYFRFPSHSETQTETPIGGFGALDARNLNNLAGKYKADYGTPFDLSELTNNELLDKDHITHIKLVDVVGALENEYAAYDSMGNKVNDPYPTPFYSSGFDLTGVGVINQGVLGTKENATVNFSVYPNPADTVITVNTVNAEPAAVTLYDASGRIVGKATTSDRIDVSALSAGIYFVEVIQGAEKATKHIVIK